MALEVVLLADITDEQAKKADLGVGAKRFLAPVGKLREARHAQIFL